MERIEKQIKDKSEEVREAYNELISSAREASADSALEPTRWSTFLSKPASITYVNPPRS
jgi:hypothetical protein